MALFDNQNTFYNSTWHRYLIPQMPSMLLNIPLWLFPNYALQWNQFNSDPFKILDLYKAESKTSTFWPMPASNNNTFSYTNYIKPEYDSIYGGGDNTPTGNGYINGLSAAASGLTTVLPALSGNTSTKLGNYAVGAGSVLSKIPGVVPQVIGSVLQIGGAAANALIGSNVNEANVKAMDSAIKSRARQLFGDNSTTDALMAGSQNNVDLINPEAKYYGSEGFLNKLRGVGKSYSKLWENSRLIDNANKQARNTELLAYKDYLNNMIRQGLLSPDFYSLAALGGLLNTVNKYNNGGSINTPRTHGGLFSSGLVEINNGGSHQANPYGGVLFGMDEYGIPNLVEEGETVFEDIGYGGPDNNAFSDEIEFDVKKYGKRFNLGGLIKNKKKKKYTFADISKYLAKDAKANPNNKIVGDTYAKNATDLANIQEEVKAERMLSQMNPLDIMAALQQSPMGEQMMGGMQEGMDLQAMMEQQLQLPMMAACGGKLFGYGGNIYADAGLITNRNKTRKRSNYIVDVNDNKILNLPKSTAIHNDLFGNAISNFIQLKNDEYNALVKDKKYQEAAEVARQLAKDIGTVNLMYVNAQRNPTENNIHALLEAFNRTGLNSVVDEYLKLNPKSISSANGARYKTDNPLDLINGIITLNRYFDFTDEDKSILSNMGININSHINRQHYFPKEFQLVNTDLYYDFLKSIVLPYLKEDNTVRVVRNPNYVEGGNEPEFIPVEQDIQSRFAPKDLDAATWWEGLTDSDKQGYYNRYGNVGDPTRTGVYDWLLIVNLSEAEQQALALAETQAKAAANNSTNKGYFVPKPRNDWESGAALAVALKDYADAYFGAGSKPQNPGIDAAYSYLSKVGNIPMVRSHPTGTKMTYRPTDLNYEVNNVRNDTFGLLRAIDNANINHGYNVATMMAALNQGRTAMGKAKQQAFEDNIKNLQAVLSNNNTIDLENAKNSLAALTTNAQNLARAREAQAQMAASLASLLGLNYNNWLDYRNSQSSGLALMLYDMGYNKLILNLKDLAFLLLNQQPDVLNVAGVLYKKVNDQYT